MNLIHLFPDLMNLYGDRGNLLFLRQSLALRGVDAQILPLLPGETLELDGVGLIYMGPGTEAAGHKALEHLRPLREALAAALEAGVPMLFTGNAWLGLGKTLLTGDGEALEGLGLFDFEAQETWERTTADAIALPAQDDLPQAPVVGYMNRCDQVSGVSSPLFAVDRGPGNTTGDPGEGLRAGSLFATHLTGPLLVKNPHLLAHFMALLGAPSDSPEDAAAREARLAYETTLAALRP